jgi:hypothetical protein
VASSFGGSSPVTPANATIANSLAAMFAGSAE